MSTAVVISGDEALYEDETVSKQHPVEALLMTLHRSMNYSWRLVQRFDQARTPHFCAALLLSNGACLRFLAAVECFFRFFPYAGEGGGKRDGKRIHDITLHNF